MATVLGDVAPEDPKLTVDFGCPKYLRDWERNQYRGAVGIEPGT